jgi:hypothetical protein
MTWSHVEPEYRSFDAIKPVLTNSSNEPIYLSRVAISGREFHPDAYPDATYPAEGQYRLVLRYAREPWTTSKTPRQVFTTRSPEFRVRWTSPS